MKESQCPAQDVNAAESASSTTSTSQESGQGKSWDERYKEFKDRKPLRLEFEKLRAEPPTLDMLAMMRDATLGQKLDRLIELQEESNNTARETNYLLAALIEAMGQDPDPNDFHEPGHL